MNKITKIFLVSVLFFGCFFASQAKATMISSDIQSMIDQLRAKINELQIQLFELKKEPAQDTCKFNLNLKLGDKGSDVEALQEALEKEGFSVGEEKNTKYFGILTRLAVTNFQEKYSDDILKPLGLKKGTGLVKESTRLKLKGIYCGAPYFQANESISVSFSYPLYSVLENESQAVITVNLSAANDKDITVEYETFNGNATPGVDYQSANGTLTFIAGQISKTFQISIIDDTIAESDETVKIKLFNLKNARLGDQAEAELDIIDNDHSEPSVYFNPVLYSVAENINAASLNVTLSKATPDTVTVEYYTSNFTAQSGGDYQSASGILTFYPNETSKNISIAILNDTVYEGNESFFVTLRNPSKAHLGLRFKSTVTINDDEQAPPTLPTVYFYPVIYHENENVNALNLKVYLSKASSDTVKVDYFTSDFSAKAGSDYQAVSDTLIFYPNETSKNISLTIINDSQYETVESFNATLKNTVNANLVFGKKISTVIIADDDPIPPSEPTVYFSPAIYSVDEGSTVSLNVYLSKASNDNVSVSYYTSEYNEGEGLGSKAVAGSDYQGVEKSLTFTPGQILKTIQIATIDDNVYEGYEVFGVTLKDVVGAQLGMRYKAGVIIKDNEQAPPALPILRFDPVFYSVNENAGSAVLYVTLSAASDNTVTVGYESSNLTAQAGSDYQAVNSSVTFSPGQISKTIPVVILNDTVYEGNESFFVTLKNPANAELGVLKTATVTIKDDEQSLPTVYFEPILNSVNENSSAIILNAKLSSASDKTVSVGYESSNLTAKAGSDYQAVNSSITFDPGQVLKTIPVSIINDNTYEGNETFFVTLKNSVNAELKALTKTATVTINDDEQAPPTVFFSPLFYSVNENAGSAVLYVTLSAVSDKTVTVNYQSSNFTATAGSDYQAVSGVLNFTPGQVSKTISVNIINDTSNEFAEIFNVTLSNPVNAEIKNLTKTATVTINDDDQALPVISFNPVFYSTNEYNTTVILYVSLSQSSANTVTVNYYTSNFTATAGSDYQATNGVLNFTSGQVQKTIPVLIFDDSTAELAEAFFVKLENPTNANLNISAKTATVTINANDSDEGEFQGQQYQGQQQGMQQY